MRSAEGAGRWDTSSYRPVTLPYRRIKHADFEPEDNEKPYPGEEQHRLQHGLAVAAFLGSVDVKIPPRQ